MLASRRLCLVATAPSQPGPLGREGLRLDPRHHLPLHRFRWHCPPYRWCFANTQNLPSFLPSLLPACREDPPPSRARVLAASSTRSTRRYRYARAPFKPSPPCRARAPFKPPPLGTSVSSSKPKNGPTRPASTRQEQGPLIRGQNQRSWPELYDLWPEQRPALLTLAGQRRALPLIKLIASEQMSQQKQIKNFTLHKNKKV